MIKHNKWSNLIDYFLLLGAVVGVGFASGKEIYNFFYIFEGYSILGLIAFAVLYVYLFFLTNYFTLKLKINSYNEFNKVVFGKFAQMAKWIMIINFSITSAGMLASSNYLCGLIFNAKILPAVILSIFEVFILLRGTKGLEFVSNILVPFMLFAIIINSINNINPENVHMEIVNKNFVSAVIFGALFGLNNFVAAMPILVESRLKYKGRLIVIASICLIILFNILVLSSNDYQTSMPMLELSLNLGNSFYIMYFITIIFALLTTYMVCSQNIYTLLFDKKKTVFGALIIVIFNLIVSNLGFEFIVKYLYLISGIISGVMVAAMVAGICLNLIIMRKNLSKPLNKNEDCH